MGNKPEKIIVNENEVNVLPAAYTAMKDWYDMGEHYAAEWKNLPILVQKGLIEDSKQTCKYLIIVTFEILSLSRPIIKNWSETLEFILTWLISEHYFIDPITTTETVNELSKLKPHPSSDIEYQHVKSRLRDLIFIYIMNNPTSPNKNLQTYDPELFRVYEALPATPKRSPSSSRRNSLDTSSPLPLIQEIPRKAMDGLNFNSLQKQKKIFPNKSAPSSRAMSRESSKTNLLQLDGRIS